MSPNPNPSFGGILEPLVDLLSRGGRGHGQLIGQEVVLHGKGEISVIIALDTENDIHLLVSPINEENDERLLRLELRGMKAEVREWSVAGFQTRKYLDLSCFTGQQPSFKRPFLKFGEDVLHELSQSDTSPNEAIYRTCKRWKNFWSPDTQGYVATEWLYGLYGELLFLQEMISRLGSQAVDFWKGPLGEDHDFQKSNEWGLEIKTSVETPFQIHCNIRQLDMTLFRQLYVVCYKLGSDEKGQTLPELVRKIENSLSSDPSSLDGFFKKLSSSGYSRQAEDSYSESVLGSSRPSVFLVDDSFPKIAETSFIVPPDHRISNIRYTLQLTGLEETELDNLFQKLQN